MLFASDGFDRDRIDAVLHLIELSLKHQTTQFGLGLAANLMPTCIHDGNPVPILQVNRMVDKFMVCYKYVS